MAIRASLVAGLLVALFAGCGSSSNSTGSAAAPTKAQFIAQADAVCRQAQAQLKAPRQMLNTAAQAYQTNGTPQNRTHLADAVRADIAVAQPQLNRLRALTPPPSDQVVINQYLSAVAGQITQLTQLASAFDSNNASAAQVASQQLSQGKATVRGLAQSYGFHVCSSGSG